jgi:RNA polymerase sigma-70 factor (ECF subfamily)
MPIRLAEERYRELGILASRCSREAFDELHRYLNQALIGYARGWIGNLDDAEELAQNTWADCFKRKSSFDPRYKFFTFLRGISRHKLLDHFRRHRRMSDLRVLVHDDPELKSVLVAGNDVSEPGDGDKRKIFFSSPDARVFSTELLELSFGCSVKPHQLLVLGFRILEWKPREILAELSNLTLAELADKLASEACRCFAITGPKSARFLTPISSQLKQKVAAVYEEPEYSDLRNDYRNAAAGVTRLKDYLRTDAAKSLYDWMDDIRTKLEQLFQNSGFHVS